MTVTYKEPLADNLSIKEMAMYDSKENILQSFRLINVKVNKNYKKAELADVLEHIFTHEPALFCNILPREEQKILAELLMYPQDHFVELPRDDYKYLLMQKLHLVITYEGLKTWHIYMPDNIRQRLNKMFEDDVKLHPDLDKMNQLFDQVVKIRERVFEILYTRNPNSLSESERKTIKREADVMAKDFESLRKKLKDLEPKVRKMSDVDFTKINGDLDTTEMYLALIRGVVMMKQIK
jgi:hypothetical protein